MHSVSELLSEFLPSRGKLRMILRGGSMHPYLQDGDILELNAANPDFKKGDIVVFKQNGSLFAHRIVRVSSTKIVTRGDAVSSPENLNKSDVIGKVIARLRDDKYTNLESFTAICYASLLPFSRSWLRLWNYLSSKKHTKKLTEA